MTGCLTLCLKDLSFINCLILSIWFQSLIFFFLFNLCFKIVKKICLSIRTQNLYYGPESEFLISYFRFYLRRDSLCMYLLFSSPTLLSAGVLLPNDKTSPQHLKDSAVTTLLALPHLVLPHLVPPPPVKVFCKPKIENR